MTYETKHVGESIFYNKYDELVEFFKDIKYGQYNYVVFNSSRAIATCKTTNGFQEITSNNVLSRDGLLFCAKEIVSYYQKHKFFPSILIIDDVLLHGRSVNELLTRLKTLIYYYLFGEEEKDLLEKYMIERSLVSRMDIQVFTMNKRSILINDIFLERLKCNYNKPVENIREFAVKLYHYSRRANSTITSEVLTYDLDKIENDNKDWIQKSWKYYAEECDIFLKTKTGSSNFVPTISTFRHQTATNVNNNKIISRVLFGELDSEVLDTICLKIADLLDSKFLSSVLRDENPLMQYERLLVIQFLSSLIYLIDFLPEEFDLEKSNIKEVSLTFGNHIEFIDDVKDLVNNKKLLKSLKITLDNLLSQGTHTLFEESVINDSADPNEINRAVELASWNLQMNSEASATRLIKNNRPICSETIQNRVSFDKFKELCDAQIMHRIGNVDFLCALIALEHYHLIKFDFGDRNPQMSIMSDKLSLNVVLKMYRNVIPACILVEKELWRLRLDCKREEAVKKFCKYILENGSELTDEERIDIKFLEDKFLDVIYKVDCLKGWNFNPMSTDEMISLYGKNLFSSGLDEVAESEKHYELARKFLKY